ncbi:MAG TPA: PhoPQ-activated protein PqaA family protein, partial [Candidatus Binatia bacterium]
PFMMVVGLFVCIGLTLLPNPALADLDEYIRKPEPNFSWKESGKAQHEAAGDLIYDLHFVSQTWQGKNWQHQLQIYRPQAVAPAAMMFLWVTGWFGNTGPDCIWYGAGAQEQSSRGFPISHSQSAAFGRSACRG